MNASWSTCNLRSEWLVAYPEPGPTVSAQASFTKRIEAEFMQYRNPVGAGPSSNTCPRCASHKRQDTAVRTIIRLPSTVSTTFSCAMGCQKLGQPVPESNLVSELNSARSQQMQRNSP